MQSDPGKLEVSEGSSNRWDTFEGSGECTTDFDTAKSIKILHADPLASHFAQTVVSGVIVKGLPRATLKWTVLRLIVVLGSTDDSFSLLPLRSSPDGDSLLPPGLGQTISASPWKLMQYFGKRPSRAWRLIAPSPSRKSSSSCCRTCILRFAAARFTNWSLGSGR